MKQLFDKKRYCHWGLVLIGVFSISYSSCTKYLDAKPNQSLVVPETLQDAVALLNDYSGVHRSYSPLAMLSSDDYYLSATYINTLSTHNRELYLWQVLQGSTISSSWRNLYSKVLRANLAIEVFNKLEVLPSEKSRYDEYLGFAYFLRAWAHSWVLHLYATAYEPGAGQQPGIPILLTADVNQPIRRWLLADCYQQILDDLDKAISLLPEQSGGMGRPGKQAAYTWKAYMLLHKGDMQSSLVAATKGMELPASALIDFNSLNASSTRPFTQFNSEVLFQATVTGSNLLSATNWRVDSNLYRLYSADDLRRTVYFRSNGAGSFGFKGDLGGASSIDLFCGISLAELYLIKAEAAVRTGNIQEAMQTLNALLEKRYRAGRFVPLAANDATEALRKVLEERQKELVGRGLRWLDVRRLNALDKLGIRPVRLYEQTNVALEPLSAKWVFQIPQEVIDLSGIEQNNR